jgi:hypothetical protein
MSESIIRRASALSADPRQRPPPAAHLGRRLTRLDLVQAIGHDPFADLHALADLDIALLARAGQNGALFHQRAFAHLPQHIDKGGVALHRNGALRRAQALPLSA